MARVLSAVALLPLVVGAVWFVPPGGILALAAVVLIVAVREYAGIARAAGIALPAVPAGAAALAAAAAVGAAPAALPAVLMAGGLAIAVTGLADRRAHPPLAAAGAAGFAVLYLGLPLGAAAAIAAQAGREALLLLLAAVMVSDTAQYYGGRRFGRRLLAPGVSPGKTVEGALCGVAAGAAVVGVGGPWGLPAAAWLAPLAPRLILGAGLAAAGIAGDLFESRLKRAAGLKDASGLIPGHGGLLDRIDALLFALPVYYLVVVAAGPDLP